MNISPLFVLSISPPPCVSRLATTISQSTFRGRRGKPFAQTLHVLCPSISVLFVGLLLRGRLSKVTPLEDCSLSPQWRWRGGFDERCAPTLLQKSCNRHFIGHRHWKGFPPVRLTNSGAFSGICGVGPKRPFARGKFACGPKATPPPQRVCLELGHASIEIIRRGFGCLSGSVAFCCISPPLHCPSKEVVPLQVIQ